jgi:hypothetical protein
MSQSNQVTSGTETSSGAGVVSGDKDQTATSGAAQSFDQKHYDKLLKEKKNAMLALEEKEQKLQELTKFKQDAEEAELLKQKQFETVINNLKAEKTKLDSELKAERETTTRARMNTALLSELKKLGFDDNDSNKEAALKLASFKNVTIDPTINAVVGAEDAAKEFYDKFNSLGFFAKKQGGTSNNAPKFNLNIGGVPDISKLTKQEKLDYVAALAKKG